MPFAKPDALRRLVRVQAYLGPGSHPPDTCFRIPAKATRGADDKRVGLHCALLSGKCALVHVPYDVCSLGADAVDTLRDWALQNQRQDILNLVPPFAFPGQLGFEAWQAFDLTLTHVLKELHKESANRRDEPNPRKRPLPEPPVVNPIKPAIVNLQAIVTSRAPAAAPVDDGEYDNIELALEDLKGGIEELISLDELYHLATTDELALESPYQTRTLSGTASPTASQDSTDVPVPAPVPALVFRSSSDGSKGEEISKRAQLRATLLYKLDGLFKGPMNETLSEAVGHLRALLIVS